MDAQQFGRPCPNLATEDSYGDGGVEDVRGRREDVVDKLRQRSASSPTSSKASGGARVGRGGEVVEETFDRDGTCIYRHGRRHIAITQVPLAVHIRGTRGGHVTHWELSHDPTYTTTVGVVVPASPGFRHKGWSIKIRFKVCLRIFC